MQVAFRLTKFLFTPGAMKGSQEQLMFEHPWNMNVQNVHKFDILAYLYVDENHEMMPLTEPCILQFY